ncbi:annexin D3 isoform X1 [Lolium perenne]|uniref:annexin D3 isoform X1 n=1 Tax=Lolium perenne TaxID=4522 RepID=UPI0021EB2369|nr:annexin D3 isoform X1 [Lolium perenne]
MATIAVPTPLPSPAADAESLRNAMQGWGTDEKALVEILGRRTGEQRAEIRRAYASVYKESLLTRLDSELSSHFQVRSRLAFTSDRCKITIDDGLVFLHFLPVKKAMILLTTDPAERDAKLVRAALEKKRGDDKDAWVLIEASCASTPDHLIAVRRVYRSLFGCSLEEDVAASSAFQQPLRTLLVSLVRSYRCAEEAVDADLARLEAATLAEAIWRKKQPHGSEVLRIVSTRSKSQLTATFQCYKEEHGSDIEQDIDNCSSQFARMLKIAVWCLTSPEKHFAEVIRYSILGLGTDEDALTRAIVSRADIDMKHIKEEYKVRFKTTVTKDVVGDCSGYYLDILLALVGSED